MTKLNLRHLGKPSFRISTAAFALSLVLSVFGKALGETPAPVPVRYEHQNVGGQTHYRFSDGRVAVLVARVATHKTDTATMTIIESSCNPASKGIRCNLGIDWQRHDYAYKWIANPVDPSRIGKLVSEKNGQDAARALVHSRIYDKLGLQMVFRRNAPDLRSPSLTCSSDDTSMHPYAWIPGFTATDGAEVTVPSIQPEYMTANPEVNRADNQVFTNLTDSHFLFRSSDGTLLFQRTLNPYSELDDNASIPAITMFVGDFATWHFTSTAPDHRYCHSSMTLANNGLYFLVSPDELEDDERTRLNPRAFNPVVGAPQRLLDRIDSETSLSYVNTSSLYGDGGIQ